MATIILGLEVNSQLRNTHTHTELFTFHPVITLNNHLAIKSFFSGLIPGLGMGKRDILTWTRQVVQCVAGSRHGDLSSADFVQCQVGSSDGTVNGDNGQD